jgi:hypothetical protein
MDLPDPDLDIPEPLTVTTLGLLGLSAGAAIVLLGATSGSSGRFLASQNGMMWAVLICIMIAFWLIVAVPAARTVGVLLRHLRHLPGDVWLKTGSRALLASLIYLCMFALPLSVPTPIVPPSPPLDGFRLRVTIMTFLGGAIAVTVLAGIFLIDAEARQQVRDLGTQGASLGDRVIELHLWLRGCLRRLIWMLAVSLTLIILETGVLRNAMADWYHEPPYPSVRMWIYGGYFSVLIALAYVPTHLVLRTCGRRIRDIFCCTYLDVDERGRAQREYFNVLLSLNTNVGGVLKSGLPLVAPIAGNVFTVLLGH